MGQLSESDGPGITPKDLGIAVGRIVNDEGVENRILIKNYFASADGTTTKSSIKYLEINGEKFLLSDFIYNQNDIMPNKKFVFNGTTFSDYIEGSDRIDAVNAGEGQFEKDGSIYNEKSGEEDKYVAPVRADENTQFEKDGYIYDTKTGETDKYIEPVRADESTQFEKDGYIYTLSDGRPTQITHEPDTEAGEFIHNDYIYSSQDSTGKQATEGRYADTDAGEFLYSDNKIYGQTTDMGYVTAVVEGNKADASKGEFEHTDGYIYTQSTDEYVAPVRADESTQFEHTDNYIYNKKSGEEDKYVAPVRADESTQFEHTDNYIYNKKSGEEDKYVAPDRANIEAGEFEENNLIYNVNRYTKKIVEGTPCDNITTFKIGTEVFSIENLTADETIEVATDGYTEINGNYYENSAFYNTDGIEAETEIPEDKTNYTKVGENWYNTSLLGTTTNRYAYEEPVRAGNGQFEKGDYIYSTSDSIRPVVEGTQLQEGEFINGDYVYGIEDRVNQVVIGTQLQDGQFIVGEYVYGTEDRVSQVVIGTQLQDGQFIVGNYVYGTEDRVSQVVIGTQLQDGEFINGEYVYGTEDRVNQVVIGTQLQDGQFIVGEYVYGTEDRVNQVVIGTQLQDDEFIVGEYVYGTEDRVSQVVIGTPLQDGQFEKDGYIYTSTTDPDRKVIEPVRADESKGQFEHDGIIYDSSKGVPFVEAVQPDANQFVHTDGYIYNINTSRPVTENVELQENEFIYNDRIYTYTTDSESQVVIGTPLQDGQFEKDGYIYNISEKVGEVVEGNVAGEGQFVHNGYIYDTDDYENKVEEYHSGNDKIYGKGGKDLIYAGSGDDYIDGGNGFDIIFGQEGNDTLKAGGGSINSNDSTSIPEVPFNGNVLAGNQGDDKLYGGSSKDGFLFVSSQTDEHDTIYSANQKDVLAFMDYDINNFEYEKEGNNLVIKTGEDSSVTLSKFFKSKNDKAIDSIYIIDDSFNIEETYYISDQATINIEGKGKINGTFLNDNIEGSDKKDTIKAGAGNDFIYAGAGNDKITGGKGSNTIDFVQGDGNDTIYLTKGENLTINYYDTDSNGNIYNQFYAYEKGNDVIIARVYTTEFGEEKIDSITIKNLGKNDLAKNVICNVYQKPNEDPQSLDDGNWDLAFSENMTDFIYQREGFIKGNKGATIKGTNLNERFVGTELKDTIKTGDGINIVDAGGGDDYIDSTKGNNTIYIEDGDGNDTILASGNSETTIALNGYNYIGYEKKGNDLIITHTPGTEPEDLDDEPSDTPETITLKNYFKTDKKGNLIKKNVSIYNNSNKTDLYDDFENTYINVIGKENKANKIDLRKYQDTFNFEVFGGNKNDKIYLGAGYHRVDSGAGNDKIYVGNGNNEIYSGTGNDYVNAGNGGNAFFYTSGNDVYESGAGDDYYCVEYSSDMNLKIRDNGGHDNLNISNINRSDLRVFFNINKNGDIIVNNNNSININSLYIFGTDEDGNSILNYDNIMQGMNGKNMQGVIEIENAFEKTFSIDNRGTEITEGRGWIENTYFENNHSSLYMENILDEGHLIYDVASWLSSYKDGYFESSIDVLSRGNKDDIEAMLAIYNDNRLTNIVDPA